MNIVRLGIDDEVRRMVREGCTGREIKDTLNVGFRRVRAIRIELGMHQPKHVRTARERALDRNILRLAREGGTRKQIAEALGVGFERVGEVIRTAKRASAGANPARFGRAVVTDLVASTQGFREMENAFTLINRDELAEWIESLEGARDEIKWLIKELKREKGQ